MVRSQFLHTALGSVQSVTLPPRASLTLSLSQALLHHLFSTFFQSNISLLLRERYHRTGSWMALVSKTGSVRPWQTISDLVVRLTLALSIDYPPNGLHSPFESKYVLTP